MGRFILLAVLALPLIEIALFVVVGKAIGVLATLAGVILSAILGGVVLRRQGLAVVGALRAGMNERLVRPDQLGDAMLIGLAGLLLIVPGYFTTALGLLLLLPPVRALVRRLVGRHVHVVQAGAATGTDQGFIDLDHDDWRER